eukprot:1600390-Karenia_brevis.AAC.1
MDVERPRGSKPNKNLHFSKIFVIPTNLPTRGHMIAILVSMAPNMAPGTLPKPPPKRKQIDEKWM